MSMTVTITTTMTELDLLMEALGQMGKTACVVEGAEKKVRGNTVLAIANIDGKRVGFKCNKEGDLIMVGDSDWSFMRNGSWLDRLQQQYSVAAVKKKAKELNYHIASIETMNDNSIRIVARAWG